MLRDGSVVARYDARDAVSVQSALRPARLRGLQFAASRVDADGVVRWCPPTSVDVASTKNGSFWLDGSPLDGVAVFPAPFGPRNPVTRPGRTSNERSSTATVDPKRFVNPVT
jgi:hypothetical protein